MKDMSVLTKCMQVIKSKPKKFEECFFFLEFEKLNQVKSTVKDVVFLRIDESNYQLIEQVRDSNKADVFLRMHKAGQYCLCALCGDAVIGHAVLIPPPARHNQVSIRKSGFIHFCYVAPEYRGMGVYPHMLSEIIMRTHDVYGLYHYSISTAPDNISSQKGLIKVGFTKEKLCKSLIWWRFTLGRVCV